MILFSEEAMKPTFPKLNRFEETMTHLAAYLIVAHHKHPRHIINDYEDQLEGRSTSKLRVTQHYATALLSYGVPSSAPELQRVAEWFATPFPHSTDNDEVDHAEMTRLEGLINLRPEDPGVSARLRRLMEQRAPNGFFELARSDDHRAPVFETLWSIKLLLQARSKGILENTISEVDLQESLYKAIEISDQDKDVALALRLHYELNHQLDSLQKEKLERLLEQGREHGHVWGVSRRTVWDRVKNIIHEMHNRQLSAGVIGAYERDFREVIINTCYVIENLRILAEDFPPVYDAVQRSMELWWRQFQGDNAPTIIRNLFSEEYDYLMVLCRTLVAVSAYVGEPLGAQLWLQPLRKMSEKYSTTGWPQRDNLEKALRGWIGIEIQKEPEELRLGLSGAHVVRVEPMVYNRLDETQKNLLEESLIIKYGPAAEIEQERENYQRIPETVRQHFVKLPEAAFTDERRQSFVVMEDLREHRTLFEIYEKLLKNNTNRLSRALSEFLIEVHRGGSAAAVAGTANHLREIYLLPMLGHVDKLVHHLNDQLSEGHINGFSDSYIEIERALNDLIADLMRYHRRMMPFPLALMHGDLHTRNIMIHVMPKLNAPWGEGGFKFRLIDLESLRLDGDAAHDVGQLLVDLNLLPRSDKRHISKNAVDKLVFLQRDLGEQYLHFAKQRRDDTFPLRLMLARGRALLRIAKGLSKRSVIQYQNREYQPAADAISEAMGLAQLAVKTLDDLAQILR